MILQDKNILVFAATGAIGSGAAKTFASHGAHVYISGRDNDRLAAIVKEIRAEGGHVDYEVVDATDPQAVDDYVNRIAQSAGQIDAVFNAIGGRPKDLGYPQVSTMTTLDDFMIPMQVIVASQFLTSRAVGRVMQEQGTGGSIITLSATLSGMTAPFMAGITAACGAIEAMTKSLAGELGQAGIRVNCVRGSGMPETRTIHETMAGNAELMGGQPPQMSLPPLGRPISVTDTVSTATFLASDLSSATTGQVLTVCAGAFV